jgi:capsular polysaccharide transport system permease protein
MAQNTGKTPDTVRMTAIEQSRNITARLSVTARKLRFSTSKRSQLYKAVGLRPRPVELLVQRILITLSLLILVVPNIASLLYFTALASDQYQSETRFTVRSSTPALGKNQLGKATDLPAAQIVQDTQIVTNFITSKGMVKALQEKIDFRKIFENPDIDPLARLRRDATIEDLDDYWENMVSVKTDSMSGIVTVKVRAFSAQEAQQVLQAVVAASEGVVNDVNARIWRDVLNTAQTNLDHAKAQLDKARESLQLARNQSGVLTVDASSAILTNLIASVQQDKINLQQKYDAQLGAVSASAPQMRLLKREIDAKEKQLQTLNSQIAGRNASQQNLADVSADMSQRVLEQSLAEQQFAASMKTLEQVQFVSKQQLLYLDTFLAPDLPDEPQYPKRGLWIAGVLAATFLLWSMLCGILMSIRNRLA